MPNTLTSLIPDAYESLDLVSRELVGFIPSVNRNSTADRVAIGQTLRSPVAPAVAAQDVVIGMQFPAAAYQVIGNKPLTISKSREVPISWQGIEQVGLNNGGPGSQKIFKDQIAQALRTLCNEIEVDLAAAHISASRAFGTAGTTPFASDISGTAQIKKILDDNGAPMSERSLVIDTSAGANMRTLPNLFRVNESGDSSLLRQGVLGSLHGFAIRESAQVAQAVVVGTGASYTTNTAGYAIGATALTLITGTGTILAGDIITLAGDTNKYVVATALAAGVVTLAAPGLRKAVAASAVAVTVLAAATRNCVFSRNAILLATRLPDLPAEGDIAEDRTVITDERSGLSFELSLYLGKRMVTYTVAASWGVAVEKPEHLAILLG